MAQSKSCNRKLSPLKSNYFLQYRYRIFDYQNKHFLLLILLSALIQSTTHEANGHAKEFSSPPLYLMEAVKITLVNNHDIRLSKMQTVYDQAEITMSQGSFDTKSTLSISNERTDSLSEIYDKADTSSISAGIYKKFRSGASITPQLWATHTKYPDSVISSGTHSGAKITIQMPLLKGRGKTVTTAEETRAKKTYQIRLLDLKHLISKNILKTVSAYWTLLSAYQNLKLRQLSLNRAEDIVHETKIFIKTGKKPESELEQALANLAEKSSYQISEEQTLIEASQNLELSMGIQTKKPNYTLLPSDPFPETNKKQILKIASQTEKIIAYALSLRPDYQALEETLKLNTFEIQIAKNNLKHQLDVSFNLGYEGQKDGDSFSSIISSYNHQVGGINYKVSLDYVWPVKNNSAKGAYIQEKTAYKKNEIFISKYAAQIRSDIIVAIYRLKTNVSRLEKAHEAEAYYQKAVLNEKLKYKLGLSTMINILTTEDRLIAAQRNKISARQSLMIAIIHIRYHTGTLLEPHMGEDSLNITMKNLTDLPPFPYLP